jgi:hypothetical protein
MDDPPGADVEDDEDVDPGSGPSRPNPWEARINGRI